MIVSLIILGALVGVGIILYVHHRLTYKPEVEAQLEASSAEGSDDSGCCGMHITCERDSLLASVSDQIEYYDDEELDRYRGRDAENYEDAEIEEFRDVLLTLLPTDIAGWGRSLQLRGISLPQPVREELLMIVSEAREHNNQ